MNQRTRGNEFATEKRQTNDDRRRPFLLKLPVMVESRVDEIETFVKELVSKVMLEAMDTLDSRTGAIESYSRLFPMDCPHPACRQLRGRKNRSLSARGTRQAHERIKKTFPCQMNLDCMSSSAFRRSPVQSMNPRSPEGISTLDVDQIRKIVQGLQGVQIGDVTSVQPIVNVPCLEREVKRAVQEMSISNEVPVAEGQGDGHDGASEEAPAIVEVECDSKDSSSPIFETVENSVEVDDANDERQTQCQARLQQEVSKLRSTCFLHRMIKELENAEARQENVLRVCTSISGISQERIAAWEESEEKFIRTIEGSKYEVGEDEKFNENPSIVEEPFVISPLDDAPTGCIVEVEIEELDSIPAAPMPLPLPPSSQSASQIPKAKEKSKSLQQQDRKQEKTKNKDKKSLGEKLRRFFRTTFKRGKDC